MKYPIVVLIFLLLATSTSSPAFADTQIAFYSDRDGDDIVWGMGFSVFVMSLDGSIAINLSKEIGMDTKPFLSPDRTKYLFWSSRNGSREIFVMNSNGSNRRNLGAGYNPRWSPDGMEILFGVERNPPLGDRDIFVMNSDGSNRRNLGTGSFPEWSPNGKKIAFTGQDVPIGDVVELGDVFAITDIYVMNADGTDKLKVSDERTRDQFLSWSPDGTKVAFHGIVDRNGHSSVYVVNVDGSDLLNLTKDFTHSWGASWSPDGRQVAFQSSADIFVINADGTNLVNLTGQNPPGGNGIPMWSPDGTKILFETDRDGNREIYTMNADGSNPVNLTNHPANDCCGSWWVNPPSALISPQDKVITTWGQIKHAN